MPIPDAALAWLLFGGFSAVGSVALAWSFPRRANLVPGALSELDGHEEPDPELRAARLLEVAGPSPWLLELLIGWDDALDDRERVASVNLALDEADHRLERGRDLPRAALSIGFVSGALASALAWHFGAGWAIFAVLAAMVAGAAGCVAAGRAGARALALQRRRVDQVAAYLAGELYERDVAMPIRRRRR